MSAPHRPSLFKSLWPRKNKQIDEVEDAPLDAALERLAQSLRDNDVVCHAVRRRQSSGSLRLISVPLDVLEAE